MNDLEDIPFRVVSDYSPAGDQPKAIAELSTGLDSGLRFPFTLVSVSSVTSSA